MNNTLPKHNQQNQQESPKYIYYFLLINSKSGNKLGSKYSQLCNHKIKYIFGQKIITYVYALDLFERQKILQGLKLAKQLSQQYTQKQNNKQLKNDVRIVVCGGDGTIPWVLHSASENKIDFSIVSLGIMPIGTGNDFSRSVGWGYKPIQISKLDIKKLHDIVKQWNKSQLGYYDIWDIQIQTFENGCFYDIKDQKQIKHQMKILKRSFTNYFGIGLDARVVYSVQKKRGSNAFLNKLLYTYVGAKNFFKSMENIQHAIQVFKQIKQSGFREQFKQIKVQKVEQLNENQMKSTPQISDQTESTQKIENMLKNKYKTKSQQNENEPNEKIFQLKKGYKGLVCLNCTSYMCGLRNVWMTKKTTNESLKASKQGQKFNDGKLEFIAFNNQITLALQRIMRTGVRIAQGQGPFQINFKQNRATSETFMQIDGQSVKIQNIKSIKVRKSLKYPNGQIKVMINNDI